MIRVFTQFGSFHDHRSFADAILTSLVCVWTSQGYPGSTERSTSVNANVQMHEVNSFTLKWI